jgi:uncharacterized membrane protein YcaP (DUF421 family)
MDSVVRAFMVYLVLLVIFRLAGKRSLAQITTFDFILLLIISEAVQPALADADDSMTNSLLLVLTLVGLDIGLSLLKGKSTLLEKLIDDVPLILVEDGQPIQERLRKSRVDESEILSSARMTQGLERMDQIKFAVLERSGGISIIPKSADSS